MVTHPSCQSFQLYLCKSVTPLLAKSRDVEAIDRFQFGGWDSYEYLYCKMEAEAEAVEAALKSTERERE